MFDYFTYEIQEHIATIVLNKPATMNALTTEGLHELETVIRELDQNKTVKVVIITGTQKAFVAGADIMAIKDMTPEQALEFSRLGHRVLSLIEQARPVVIAAINGFALGGGCELAMACDIRVAVTSAKLGIPETLLGVIPGFSGTQRLPRLVGLGIAKELLATGSKITAQRAYEIGLVNHCVPNEELMEFCRNLAETITKNSTNAISVGKKLMNLGIEMDIDKAEEYEASQFGVIFSTEDQKEGMSAFLEKRSPAFH